MGGEGEPGWVLMNPTLSLTGWMAASSNGFLVEALGEFSLTSLSRPVCLSTADPASDWGGLSQAARWPDDWSQLSGLSAGERGILNSSVMLTGDEGWGKGSQGKTQRRTKLWRTTGLALSRVNPLSQINDPQFPIFASNCTKWWIVNISPLSSLKSSKKSSDNFLNFFRSILMYSWCHTTVCFSIIGHFVTSGKGKRYWNLLNTYYVPRPSVILILGEVGVNISQVIGKDTGKDRWLTCRVTSSQWQNQNFYSKLEFLLNDKTRISTSTLKCIHPCLIHLNSAPGISNWSWFGPLFTCW